MAKDVEVKIRVRAEDLDKLNTKVKQLGGTFVSTGGAAGKVGKQLGDVGPKAATAGKGVNSMGRAMGEARTQAEQMGARMGPLGAIMGKLGPAGLAAGVALAGVAAVMVKVAAVGKDFEQALADLSAITGATGKDLDFLSDAARRLGATTTKTATEAATAFKLIASAKPELLENAAALATVTEQALRLSEAAGLTLPQAASALTNALNQFGESAESAGRFINVLAAGAKLGAAEIPALEAAVTKSGTVAAQAGLSFEQLNAVLQRLAQFGQTAEEFGTSFRNVLLILQKGANDTNPAVVGLTAALDNLADKSLSTAELVKLFGTRNVVVAKQLIETRDSIADLTVQLDGTNVAYEQAAIRTDTLTGKQAELSSALEELGLTLAESTLPLFRSLVESATGFVREATDVIAKVREIDDALSRLPAEVVIAVKLLFAGPSGEVDADAIRAQANEALGEFASESFSTAGPFAQVAINHITDAVGVFNEHLAELNRHTIETADSFEQAGQSFLVYEDRVLEAANGLNVISTAQGVVTAATQTSAEGLDLYGQSVANVALLNQQSTTELVEQTATLIIQNEELRKAADANLSRAEGMIAATAAAEIANGTDANTVRIWQEQALAALEINDLFTANAKAAKIATRARKDFLATLTDEALLIAAKRDEVVALAQSGADLVTIEDRLAVLSAQAKDTTGKHADAIAKLVLQMREEARAIEKVTDAEKERGDLQEELEFLEEQARLLQQVADKTLTLAEADIQLAEAQALLAGDEANQDLIRRVEALRTANATQREGLEDLAQAAEDATFDLGNAITNIMSQVAVGLAQGTNDGLDAIDLLKNSGKALFAEMLSGMLQDKFSFDLKIEKNFLKDIPGTIGAGLGIVGSLIGGAAGLLGFNGVAGVFGGGGSVPFGPTQSGGNIAPLPVVGGGGGFSAFGNFAGSVGGAFGLPTGGGLGGTLNLLGSLINDNNGIGNSLSSVGQAISLINATTTAFTFASTALANYATITGSLAASGSLSSIAAANSAIQLANLGITVGASGQVIGSSVSSAALAAGPPATGSGGIIGSLITGITNAITAPLGAITTALGIAPGLIGGGALGSAGVGALGVTAGTIGAIAGTTFVGPTVALTAAELALLFPSGVIPAAFGGAAVGAGVGSGGAALGGAGAGISATTAGTTAGIAAAVVALVEGGFALAAANETVTFDSADRARAFEQITEGGLLEFLGHLGGARAFNNSKKVDELLGGDFAIENFAATTLLGQASGGFGLLLAAVLRQQGSLGGRIQKVASSTFGHKVRVDKFGDTKDRAALLQADLGPERAAVFQRADNPTNAFNDPALEATRPGRFASQQLFGVVRRRTFEELASKFETTASSRTGGLTAEERRLFIGAGTAFRALLGTRGDLSNTDVSFRGVSLAGGLARGLRVDGSTREEAVARITDDVLDLGGVGGVIPALNKFFQRPENSLTVSDYQDAIFAVTSVIEIDFVRGVNLGVIANEQIAASFTEASQATQDHIRSLDLTNERAVALGEALTALGLEGRTHSEVILEIAAAHQVNGQLTQEGVDLTAAYRDALAAAGVRQHEFGALMAEGALTAEELQRVITDLGVQGVVAFEDIVTAITAAIVTMETINPLLDQAFERGFSDASAGQITQSFFTDLQGQMFEAISVGLRDAFIDSTLHSAVLGPFFEAVQEGFAEFGDKVIDFPTLKETLLAAFGDAQEGILTLTPFLQDLIGLANELRDAFVDAAIVLDASDFGDTAAGIAANAVALATAAVQLQAAADAFDRRLQIQINTLRGDPISQFSNQLLLDLEREAQLLMEEFFHEQVFVPARGPGGKIVGGGKGTFETRRRTDVDLDVQALALQRMEEILGAFLQTRLAQIQQELAEITKVHVERIADLQEEAAAIQDAARDAIQLRQEELALVNEQLQVVLRWQAVVDTVSGTLLSIRTGQQSPEDPLARLGLAQAAFEAQRSLFFDAESTDAQRQAAAGQLTQLAPQILGLLGAAGLVQGSEAFRGVFGDVTDVLEAVRQDAAERAAGLDDLQQRQTDLTQEIKDIQEQANEELEAIADAIDRERDAIVAAQDRAAVLIDRVNNNVANVLEWVRGEGNRIFKERQDEIAAQLDELGLTNIDMDLIQANSLVELRKIVALLEGRGFDVVENTGPAGAFGLTREAQRDLKQNLPTFGGAGSPTHGRFQLLSGPGGATEAGLEKLAGTDPRLPGLIDTIFALFPDLGGPGSDFRAVAAALAAKMAHPDTFQPLLGFAHGGLVTGPTMGMLGEAGRELVIPLENPAASTAAQAFFANVAQNTRASGGGGSVEVNVYVTVDGSVGNAEELGDTLAPIVTQAVRDAMAHDSETRREVRTVARTEIAQAPRR